MVATLVDTCCWMREEWKGLRGARIVPKVGSDMHPKKRRREWRIVYTTNSDRWSSRDGWFFVLIDDSMKLRLSLSRSVLVQVRTLRNDLCDRLFAFSLRSSSFDTWQALVCETHDRRKKRSLFSWFSLCDSQSLFLFRLCDIRARHHTLSSLVHCSGPKTFTLSLSHTYAHSFLVCRTKCVQEKTKAKGSTTAAMAVLLVTYSIVDSHVRWERTAFARMVVSFGKRPEKTHKCHQSSDTSSVVDSGLMLCEYGDDVSGWWWGGDIGIDPLEQTVSHPPTPDPSPHFSPFAYQPFCSKVELISFASLLIFCSLLNHNHH